MLKSPVLSEEHLSAFERDGFCVVRGAFDAEAMAAIEGCAEELVSLPEEPGKHHLFREQSQLDPSVRVISRIEYISPFVPGFALLAETLKPPVAQLLDEEPLLFKEKVNFKMSGGDGFKPHQDSQAGWDRYADYFINVALTIDPSTIENGCLELVSGHHRDGLFQSWEPLSEEQMKGMEFVAVPTQPGDLVFFDCFTPHASEPNHTANMRRIYFATYNRLSAGDHLEQYYADKRASYPPDIEREEGREYVFRV